VPAEDAAELNWIHARPPRDHVGRDSAVRDGRSKICSGGLEDVQTHAQSLHQSN